MDGPWCMLCSAVFLIVVCVLILLVIPNALSGHGDAARVSGNSEGNLHVELMGECAELAARVTNIVRQRRYVMIVCT